jgi:N utilization substance protein A
MSESIRQLKQDRNMSEELILKTIEDILIAAYKRRFGHDENAVVRFSDDNNLVSIYAKKKIVDADNHYDPTTEIELDEARELNPEAEINDELLIEVDPKDFDRGSVQIAKQKATQSIRDIQKDTLHAEFAEKIGEIIIGYYQREKNGTIFVDIGKVEGKLLKKYQSPREEFHVNDRIKSLIVEVKKG